MKDQRQHCCAAALRSAIRPCLQGADNLRKEISNQSGGTANLSNRQFQWQTNAQFRAILENPDENCSLCFCIG
jgi:hypothetical protein